MYNRADCVLNCLESVAAENIGGGKVEHVLADDGSTDNSVEVIENFIATHPDVKLVRLPYNKGTNAARNAAIAAATGEFVLFIDSDDCLAPGSIARIVSAMDSHRGYDHYLFRCSHNSRATERYGDFHEFDFREFLLGDVYCDFAHVINRRTLLELPFGENLRIHEVLFHLRFYRKAKKILYTNELVSLVDQTRSDHVTFTTRKTNDRALRESLLYTNLMIDFFKDDFMEDERGRSRLRELYEDKYKYSVLSGKYSDADAVPKTASPLAYRLVRYTHSGPLMWNAVKIAMRLKWRLKDSLSR